MAQLKPRFETHALSAPAEFRKALCEWFDRHGKDYPWRRTKDPYRILVSEVMLQQTRIASVLGKGYYTRFLQTFPNLETLARADDGELLKAWEGLGYYRRARMLRDTACAVLRDHDGAFPDRESALLALPGVGHYTAAALTSFAFDQPSALVDGNVSRVLSRLMDDDEPINSASAIRKHRDWARSLCDPDHPAKYQHAIMEIGQTICIPGNPKCLYCPISRFCKSTKPEQLPIRKARPAITDVVENAIWAVNRHGALLLHQENGTRRRGLWKLPLRGKESCETLDIVYESTYFITRYKVALRVFLATEAIGITPQDGEDWVDRAMLDSLPFAAPFRKAISEISNDF